MDLLTPEKIKGYFIQEQSELNIEEVAGALYDASVELKKLRDELAATKQYAVNIRVAEDNELPGRQTAIYVNDKRTMMSVRLLCENLVPGKRPTIIPVRVLRRVNGGFSFNHGIDDFRRGRLEAATNINSGRKPSTEEYRREGRSEFVYMGGLRDALNEVCAEERMSALLANNPAAVAFFGGVTATITPPEAPEIPPALEG